VQEVAVRRLVPALLAAALAALALGLVAAAGAPGSLAKAATPKIVKVKDNFYSPDGVRVKKRGKVRWAWTQVFNNHDVTLRKAPEGVRKSDFRSQTTNNPDYSFTKKFKKVGKYKFYCTVHPDVMRMTVRVHR
jgi:plastocyanin